jgi:hypothetical protein
MSLSVPQSARAPIQWLPIERMKSREPRHRVLIQARLRWEGRWVAASVGNVSSRGLMLRTASPPPAGTHVEIQLPIGTVVARSMWTNQQSCGLRSQNVLDVAALRGTRRGEAEVKAAAVASDYAKLRRSGVGLRERAERSKRLSSLVQFVTVVAVSVCAAGSLGWEVYNILSAPAKAIEARI